jgi:hypothetical protein
MSPLDTLEEARFPKMISALGGVISGFTIAKAGEIVTFLSGKFPQTSSDPVVATFIVLAPSSTFLAGLISSFVFRHAVISLQQNRRDVLRRKLDEFERADHPN